VYVREPKRATILLAGKQRGQVVRGAQKLKLKLKQLHVCWVDTLFAYVQYEWVMHSSDFALSAEEWCGNVTSKGS